MTSKIICNAISAGYTFHDDHRDPFDRLSLATAIAENIPVVSADEKFQRYSDLVAVIS